MVGEGVKIPKKLSPWFMEDPKYLESIEILLSRKCIFPFSAGTAYTLEELKNLRYKMETSKLVIIQYYYSNNITIFQNHSEVCRKFNIIVLSDEIYGLLNFKGQ